MDKLSYTIVELEDMAERDLESIILGGHAQQDDARFVLGKLLIEGASDLVQKNEVKGLNWLKESLKKNHMLSFEYKTYFDIRFGKNPQISEIKDNLQKIIEHNKSSRACNVFAELAHASAGGGGKLDDLNAEQTEKLNNYKDEAAKHYLISAEQGDVVAMHWIGVFYHEGYGVAKNMDKAIQFLIKAGEAGNGLSFFQLYMIFSGKEGQDVAMKDCPRAYNYLMNSIYRGITIQDEAIAFFAVNYKVLAPEFIKIQKLDVKVTDDNQKEIMNMHDALVQELKTTFSAALSKDRLYNRPCGFLNDQQIYLLGLNVQYFADSVLRYSHSDFLKAMKQDLGPAIGNVGLWTVKCLKDQAKQEGKDEEKKKFQVIYDILEKYLDSGLEVLGQEKKYYFMNKFGPKKCPEKIVKRENIRNLYPWFHYAPQ